MMRSNVSKVATYLDFRQGVKIDAPASSAQSVSASASGEGKHQKRCSNCSGVLQVFSKIETPALFCASCFERNCRGC
jgi:hypothetical protein